MRSYVSLSRTATPLVARARGAASKAGSTCVTTSSAVPRVHPSPRTCHSEPAERAATVASEASHVPCDEDGNVGAEQRRQGAHMPGLLGELSELQVLVHPR